MPLPVGALACFHPVSLSSSWNRVHVLLHLLHSRPVSCPVTLVPAFIWLCCRVPSLPLLLCLLKPLFGEKIPSPSQPASQNSSSVSKPVESRSPLRPHLPDPLRRRRCPSAWPLEGQLPACCPVFPGEHGFTAFFVNLPTFFPPPPVPDVVLTDLVDIVTCFEH